MPVNFNYKDEAYFLEEEKHLFAELEYHADCLEDSIRESRYHIQKIFEQLERLMEVKHVR